MISGRDFTDLDLPAPSSTVIVTESLARQAWRTASAVGERLTIRLRSATTVTVVGIVRDSAVRNVGEAPQPHLYRPLGRQFSGGLSVLVLETGTDPAAMVAPVRQTLLGWAEHPSLCRAAIGGLRRAVVHRGSTDGGDPLGFRPPRSAIGCDRCLRRDQLPRQPSYTRDRCSDGSRRGHVRLFSAKSCGRAWRSQQWASRLAKYSRSHSRESSHPRSLGYERCSRRRT